MKSHAWQVTTKDGQQVVLFAEGEFKDSSHLLKTGFRNAEAVRYRGEVDMPTFRGRPKDENAVTASTVKAKSGRSGGQFVAQKRTLTGAARQRLLKQLAAARKVRLQNLK